MGLLITDGLTQILISVHGDFITKVKVITISISQHHIKPWVSDLHHTVQSVTLYSITDDTIFDRIAYHQKDEHWCRHTLFYTHRSVTHSHKNVHTGLLFLLFDAQVPRWSLSVPSRRQPVSHEGRLAVGLWVWGLAEGDVDWNDMQVSVICGIQYTHAES